MKISMIIFAGIVSSIPSGIYSICTKFFAEGIKVKSVAIVAIIAILAVLAIVFVVLFNSAERRIPVQYAKRVVGNKQYGGVRQYIPLKINAAGVMPIILAQAIMMF